MLFNVKMSLLWENHSSVNLLRFNKQIMRSRCRLVPEILWLGPSFFQLRINSWLVSGYKHNNDSSRYVNIKPSSSSCEAFTSISGWYSRRQDIPLIVANRCSAASWLFLLTCKWALFCRGPTLQSKTMSRLASDCTLHKDDWMDCISGKWKPNGADMHR